MKFHKYCLLALLLPTGILAQTKPLYIGDKVPDAVYRQLNIIPGAITIIYFWNRYCSSCIASFPRLEAIQSKHLEMKIVTVSDITDTVTLKRMTRTTLPVILGPNSLKDYFPHQIVPHVVWIAPEGTVTAITGLEYLKEENLSAYHHKPGL